MSCPKEELIVRLVSGELPDTEQGDLRQHLRSCPRCAGLYEGLRKTWDELGGWDFDPAGIDLSNRVLARVTDQEQEAGRGTFFRWRGLSGLGDAARTQARGSLSWLRMAASIALAAGLGMATGVLTPLDWAARVPRSAAAPTAEEVMDSLGLSEFGSGSATGLDLAFETQAPADTEVEP